MFHENPLLGRRFTWNIKHYFIRKTMKKYSRLSSAAVVVGAFRVNTRLFQPAMPAVFGSREVSIANSKETTQWVQGIEMTSY